MTSKTHIATGIAVATAFVQPGSIKSFAICTTAATIGSIISDIDVTTSESHKDLNKILAISTIVIFLCAIVDLVFKINIYSYILGQTNLCRILIGLLTFLLICSFGMHKPHRTFMHSITAMIILDATVFIILPSAVIPFSIAMLTHIILDLFNRKKVQLFYPVKFKFAFKLCPAQGKVNNFICTISTILFAIEITFFIIFLVINR